MKGTAIILALLALPVGARPEGTNLVWMFAQQYVAESEALHFCLSGYDSSVRDNTYMPAATKDKVATCVFLKMKDNTQILTQAEELIRKAGQQ
jgi:hypothetical protein